MITNSVEYIISRICPAARDDGRYEYLMLNLFAELPGGNIALSKGMAVSRDFVYSLAILANVTFFTAETTPHNTLVLGQPVFIDNGFLTLHPGCGSQYDSLGQLPTFDVEVSTC